MDTPTLRIGEYRGVKIYVRKLGVEKFEYLIAMDGQIFCNQVEINRPVGKRLTKYTDDDLEGAIKFMTHVAEQFIDDRLFEQEESRRWKNRWARFRQKVGDRAFHYWYVFTEWSDKIKTNYERKIKRGKSG